ncbi:MAG: helix-turn-helix transcriptional regulator [Paludibacteraceae bacterium]|nr:helix-turn-helix transcriptional regulator [Paludibacteraceae bacterium]MCR4620175.1 XRE family transcriptional regulator [Paludibacteraceae bacterium]
MGNRLNEIKEVSERLRGLRDALDLSVAEAAARVKVSEEQYASYESGEADIPMSFLWNVAHSFGVEMTALISGSSNRQVAYSVVRKGKGIAVNRGNNYHYQSLTGVFKNPKGSPFYVTAEPKSEGTPFHLNTHESEELDFVIEGTVDICIDGKMERLEAGDSIYFDARRPHGLKAVGETVAKLISIAF